MLSNNTDTTKKNTKKTYTSEELAVPESASYVVFSIQSAQGIEALLTSFNTPKAPTSEQSEHDLLKQLQEEIKLNTTIHGALSATVAWSGPQNRQLPVAFYHYGQDDEAPLISPHFLTKNYLLSD